MLKAGLKPVCGFADGGGRAGKEGWGEGVDLRPLRFQNALVIPKPKRKIMNSNGTFVVIVAIPLMGLLIFFR